MTTEEELRDAAFLALHAALGPADGLRFMRYYRPEPGDFTQEKYLYLGNPSLDELLGRIECPPSGTPEPDPATNPRSDEEVRQLGFQALRAALGPRESVRFIRLCAGSDPSREQEFVESCHQAMGRGAA